MMGELAYLNLRTSLTRKKGKNREMKSMITKQREVYVIAIA